MTRALPSSRALQAFEAAARRLSFTDAARELRLAQPAVARYVAGLEAYVGAPLFERRNNRLSLTPEGRSLRQSVAEGLARIEDGLDAVERRRGGTVVIAATFAFAHLWLMPRFGALRRALGDRRPILEIADDHRDHEAPHIDLSLRYALAADVAGRATLLAAEEVFPVAAPEIAERCGEDPARWRAGDLIEQEDLGKGAASWSDWFAHAGVVPPPVRGRRRYRNYLEVVEAARSGEGVALGMARLTDGLEAAGALRRIGPALKRTDAGLWAAHRPLDRRAARLAAALAEIA
ncbi:MAG: LysR family transcriptional regulator [Pseudomonadota bacterium]